MRPAVYRLLLVCALLVLVSGAKVIRADTGRPVALAAGALLLCGLFAGKVAKGVGLPRLTGYLLIGVLIGPYGFGIIPKEGVAGLELVKGLAVSLIALTAGTELRWALLKRVGSRAAWTAGAICLAVFVVAWVVVVAMRPFLPFLEEVTWGQAAAIGALLASVLVSFSPTVTIAILQETQAKGPFSELLMAVVIIGDLWVMILFALAAGVTKASLGGDVGLGMLIGSVGWELFGSLVVGAFVGMLTLTYLRRVQTERALFLIGICFLSAEAGLRLHLSPLLVALAAGALIANADQHEAERLNVNVERIGLPVFALFFAAAGANLHLSALRDVGLVAVGLVAVRAVAIYGAARTFAPPEPEPARRFLWMGLISQAGVTFGLASLVARTFPSFGPSAEVLLVAIVSLHELIGPVLMRRALQGAGELPGEVLGPVAAQPAGK